MAWGRQPVTRAIGGTTDGAYPWCPARSRPGRIAIRPMASRPCAARRRVADGRAARRTAPCCTASRWTVSPMSRRTPRIARIVRTARTARTARIGRLSLAALVLLTVVLTGCGSGAAAPPVAACSDQTQLTMTRDAADPTMNWRPASAVSFVAIVQEEASVMACGIRTPMPSLAPPQQANIAPSGAFELASRPLRVGVPYTMIHGVRDTRSTTGAIGGVPWPACRAIGRSVPRHPTRFAANGRRTSRGPPNRAPRLSRCAARPPVPPARPGAPGSRWPGGRPPR